MLPVAAEVTGPVDRRPAEEPAPSTDAQPLPAAATEALPAADAEPVPAAATSAPTSVTPAEPETAPVPTAVGPAEPAAEPAVVAASAVEPEPAHAPTEPEPTRATPIEPAPAAATTVESAPAAATTDEPESTPAEPVVVPAGPVVVPAPRGEVDAPVATDSDAADDFRRIQGVGPKMAAALQAAGIRTYRQLAELDEAALRETIRAAGLRAAPSLATWPQQAKVLAGAPQEAAAALPTPVGGADA
nr:helix-hairpin-helix domain-containing protein [Micromonospora sp. AMSO12t]